MSLQPALPAACAARYQVARKLAAGGFGTVWTARQKGLDRLVALKLLHRDRLDDPEQSRRFVREARVTASLNHANIVTVYDFGVDEGVPWIAYELLEGGSLRDKLAEGPLAIDAALDAAEQIARALEAAHAAGVLHRDIKPDNVLLADPGVCKVADFGIARWGGSQTLPTRAGLLLGTPAYLAPEYIEGGEPTAATDLYALGVLLFELLTGRTPFVADSPLELLRLHLEASPPALTSLRPAAPAALERLLSRALQRDPAGRFASASEFLVALRDARSPQPAPAATQVLASVPRRDPGPAQPTRVAVPGPARFGSPPTSNRTRLAAIVLAAALASGALFILRSRRAETAPSVSNAPTEKTSRRPPPPPAGPLPLPAPAVDPALDAWKRQFATFQRLEASFRQLAHKGKRIAALEDPESGGSYFVNAEELRPFVREGLVWLAEQVRQLDRIAPRSEHWVTLWWQTAAVLDKARQLGPAPAGASFDKDLGRLEAASRTQDNFALRRVYGILTQGRIGFARDDRKTGWQSIRDSCRLGVLILSAQTTPGWSGSAEDLNLRIDLCWQQARALEHLDAIGQFFGPSDTQAYCDVWWKILTLGSSLVREVRQARVEKGSLAGAFFHVILAARSFLESRLPSNPVRKEAVRIVEAVLGVYRPGEWPDPIGSELPDLLSKMSTRCAALGTPLRVPPGMVASGGATTPSTPASR